MRSITDGAHLTIILALFSTVSGLFSVNYDVPPHLSQQTLGLCPCSLGDRCNTTVTVPMMESTSSLEWYHASSSNFQSTTTRSLRCQNQQLQLTITEGSFVLLHTGELYHVHARLILDKSSFCLKRSFSQDYVMDGDNRLQEVVLEAEICITPPTMNLCCPSGSVLSQLSSPDTESNVTFSCTPSSAPPLLPAITFDGSSHKWRLEGEVQGLPSCHQNLSTIPVNVGQAGFGHLQLVEDQLQFRWQPGASKKVTSVDSSKFCIGQERSFRSVRPVVAVCQPDHDPGNYCQARTCYGKCCPDDQVYDLDSNMCVASSFAYTWKPVQEAEAEYQVVYGMPSCDSFFAISVADPDDTFSFLENGSLRIDSWSEAVSVPDYCFDVFRNQTHHVGMALVCFGDEDAKPHDNLEDQSTVLYVMSSVLLIGVTHLLIAMAFYVRTVKKENSQDSRPTNGEPQVYLQLNIFQWLVCAFISFSAIQVILVSLLQFLHTELNAQFCNIVASVAEWASLVASVLIVALWLQVGLSLHSPKVWQRALLFLSPLLLATLVMVVAIFVSPAGPQTCDINAAFEDPWSAWLVTTAHGVLLLTAFAGLSLPLCWRRYTLTKMAPNRQQHLCCIGTDPQEQDMQVKSDLEESRDKNDCAKELSTELRLENNRWWLLLKLDCLLLAASIAFLSVWQQDAVAFWAFGDIVLAFKSNVTAACLWLYLCKHCKRN